MKYCEFKKYISIILSISYISTIYSKERDNIEKRSIITNLNRGIKYAGHIFGINTAADVANLIAKGFSHAASAPHSSESNNIHANEEKDEQTNKENVYKKLNFFGVTAGLLRFIRFDITKIGALALSTILGIAETIASLVLRKNAYQFNIENFEGNNFEEEMKGLYTSSDEARHSTINANELFESFLQQSSPKFRELLSKATNKELPEHIILMIESAETKQHQAACVKMLICKCAPFIWNMQKTLAKRLTEPTVVEKLKQDHSKTQSMTERKMFDVNALFKELPSKLEVLTHGKLCSERYANLCNITESAYDNDTKC